MLCALLLSMPRVDKINSLLIQELAELISREISLEGGLITVAYVDCSPDLRYAKIGVSVLPDNLSGSALKKLKKHNAAFAARLKKKLNLKIIPKFNWEIDDREINAAEIEKIINSPEF